MLQVLNVIELWPGTYCAIPNRAVVVPVFTSVVIHSFIHSLKTSKYVQVSWFGNYLTILLSL